MAADMTYLHEELGAFGHHQAEDERRTEARDGAQHHEDPPALHGQRTQRDVSPGGRDHPPREAWGEADGHTDTVTITISHYYAATIRRLSVIFFYTHHSGEGRGYGISLRYVYR